MGVSSGTIAHGMLFYLGGKTDMNDQRPGIVHRLDKDTSVGIVISKINLYILNFLNF